MAVRAAGWAFLGILLATGALAAERPPVPPNASADSLPLATDARLGGDESQTRFVMDFSRKIELRAFTLADPYRVVVDIPQVIFQLPPKAGESGRGLIKAFRFGLVMQGGSRLVFDVSKPVRIEKAFVVDPTDGAPARLVLELAPTDREAFLHKMAIDNRAARRWGAHRPRRRCGTLRLDPRRRAAAQGRRCAGRDDLHPVRHGDRLGG